MKLRTIKEIQDLKDKKVLLRIDGNVPLTKNGHLADDYRLRAVLPTMEHLLDNGAKVIILSHLGRPKGKVVPELSNKVVSQRLSELLGEEVIQLNEVIGESVNQAIAELKAGEILMLENIRFQSGEEEDSQEVAQQLAALGELFVNDAFAVCHRAGASISGLTQFLPSYAGLLVEKEFENLSKVLESPLKPKMAIIGGAKLETKVKVIDNLSKKMDYVLVGGAIANNFLKAQGLNVGQSLVDNDYLEEAKRLLVKNLAIPQDAVVALEIKAEIGSTIKSTSEIGDSDIILDLGPITVEKYLKIIKEAKLVVWNGPLGYFELPQYKKGSMAIAKAIAESQAESIVGGGETVQLIEELGLKDKFSFVSTGGGAMLEFLEGKILPGLKPLIKN